MHFPGILLLTAFWLCQGTAAGPRNAAVELSIPGESEFTNATIRWTEYRAPSYSAALSIGSEEDLVTAVKLATAHNIPFLATGGRHGYSGTLGDLHDGLALDLSPLNSISINGSAGTLTVGPGVRVSEIYDPVFEAGYQIQTGICSCVGMIGLTLGAGIGRQQGSNGLVLDALLSARVVTASGEVVEASKTSNPDLFWAIRGAGPNFGIVSSATYQLYPLSGTFTSIDLAFPARLNSSFFQALADFNLTENWAIATYIFYDTASNKTGLRASCVYHGPQAEAIHLLTPILDLGPKEKNITELPWSRLTAEGSFGLDASICTPGGQHELFAANLRHRNTSAWVSMFNAMDELYASTPGARQGTVLFEAWSNQAMMAVPDEETAYPWRDTQVYVSVQNAWTEGDDGARDAAAATAQAIREELAATSGYGGLAVYLNYAHGDETIEEVYSERKLPRLAELKRMYDPDNVFRYYHALPTAYP
ncbi:hypothetical protein ASPVEDRAFT_49867 [Aspergillus versicolor CBS 583.65]|uniref:FAD-binding PCMH-type domain-containing protein n=1 Tax=Aspergillus versicolor CBS 583.65 TaxID=1036611 RepID=A0A1L9P905_ASPVE|nr:uncharacterized protein ASPVEDRAFT_49867 [Aspergillus versicolor CBS 583.65]OJI98007.1 hypothetical protein ASPVEDRAFT_49867 [Aspergillus versicolor CBS 583.65]